MDYDLADRTFRFAIQVLEVFKAVPENRVTGVVITQLSKSATSVGANYEESQATHSREDFYYRIGICRREIREHNYRLRIIAYRQWSPNTPLLEAALTGSAELKNIFGKIYSGRNQDERKQDKRNQR